MKNNIKLYLNNHTDAIPLSFFIFNGGEEHVKIDMEAMTQFNEINEVKMDVKIDSSQVMIQLLMVNDALERSGLLNHSTKKILNVGYMPGARQDRVCEPGEALSLAVYASLINSINAHQVVIEDPHSDVTGVLIKNIKIIHQEDIVIHKLGDYLKSEKVTLVSPDAGALKKIYGTAQKLDLPVIEASKKRDTKTGKIVSTHIELFNSIPNSVMIIDDICDGGRTFIELAKVLKNKGVKQIYLYVTHGIFSQGLSVFDGYIDTLFTNNLWDESLISTHMSMDILIDPLLDINFDPYYPD